MVICNLLGRTHCGREIEESEVAYSAVVHVHYANRPHAWEPMYQCKECYAKQQGIRDQCSKSQETLREKRQALDLSMGEAARKLGMKVSEYSQIEALRRPASDAEIEAILAKLESQ